MNTIASIWLRKYARIFVLGHYLFLEAHSFPRASLLKNCSLLGTDNVRGQISEHIFAPNEGYCLCIGKKWKECFINLSHFAEVQTVFQGLIWIPCAYSMWGYADELVGVVAMLWSWILAQQTIHTVKLKQNLEYQRNFTVNYVPNVTDERHFKCCVLCPSPG